MNIFWANRNPNEWHRPNDFLPDRFDPEHELFKTPDGRQRKPHAYIPFNVGSRKCVGYVFAKTIMPNLISKIIQNFDIEFVDKSLNDEHVFPVATTATNHTPPIEVKLFPRDVNN